MPRRKITQLTAQRVSHCFLEKGGVVLCVHSYVEESVVNVFLQSRKTYKVSISALLLHVWEYLCVCVNQAAIDVPVGDLLAPSGLVLCLCSYYPAWWLQPWGVSLLWYQAQMGRTMGSLWPSAISCQLRLLWLRICKVNRHVDSYFPSLCISVSLSVWSSALSLTFYSHTVSSALR